MLYYLSVLILTYFVYEVKRNKKGATVAQSVEQLIRNQQVAGSSPASSSKLDLIEPNGSIKSFFVETTQFDTFYLINILRFAVLQPQKAILIAVCNTRLTTNSTGLDCDFLFSLQNFVANIDLLFEK